MQPKESNTDQLSETAELIRPKPRIGDGIILFMARWFNSGLAPKAPGTFGTLATLPLFYLLKDWRPWSYFSVVLVLSLLGIPISNRAAYLLGKKDPSEVVIDEAAGVLIALGFVLQGPLWLQGVAVLLFRVFDILKPGPIYCIQFWKPYGLGIMIDDIAAGILAGVISLGLGLFISAY